MSYLGFCPPGVIMPYAGATAPDGWLFCDGSEISKTTYSALSSSLSYNASVTTVNASANVTTASTAFVSVGAAVTGTGIPAGAYVTSITNATTFVISANATASGTVSATFSLYDRQTNPTSGSAYAAPAAGNFRLPDYRGLFLRGTGTPYGTRGDGTAGSFDRVNLGEIQVQKTAKNGLTATTSGTDGTHTHALNTTPHNVAIAPVAAGAGGTGISSLNGASVQSTNSGHGHTITVAGDTETRPINRGVNYIIKI